MAQFEITEGAPGQGKSLYTANLTLKLLDRNVKWYNRQMHEFRKEIDQYKHYLKSQKDYNHLSSKPKSKKELEKPPRPVKPKKRKVLSNIRMADHIEKKYRGYIEYWINPDDIVQARDVDIIWDEIATHLDARRFALLSDDLTMFLSQYRKNGVDIYANTQDFSMIDARARLMITTVRTMRKVIGSPDPSPTKPKIKKIWGVVWIREVLNYKETDPEKKKYSWLPQFLWISKELIDVYDTRQKIEKGEAPPYKHITRKCEHADDPNHDCNFHKNIHI
jgi:hypothetical protein